MSVKTFWIETLPKTLWVYRSEAPGPCPANGGRQHVAETPPLVETDEEHEKSGRGLIHECTCGFKFASEHKTGHGRRFWRRLGDEKEETGRFPPGALYVGPGRPGHDGKSVICVLPNGDHWWIDSRASNCTRKDDDVHRCWIRHGTVGEVVHVDKNGNTCQAGAGSIMSGDYHGFLHNGVLT